ncbi:unnamed protein product [Coregonus sp. 'balchen']|nr:unnamed protein product [Coregonus sp. 'balchen']
MFAKSLKDVALGRQTHNATLERGPPRDPYQTTAPPSSPRPPQCPTRLSAPHRPHPPPEHHQFHRLSQTGPGPAYYPAPRPPPLPDQRGSPPAQTWPHSTPQGPTAGLVQLRGETAPTPASTQDAPETSPITTQAIPEMAPTPATTQDVPETTPIPAPTQDSPEMTPTPASNLWAQICPPCSLLHLTSPSSLDPTDLTGIDPSSLPLTVPTPPHNNPSP